VEKPQIIKVEAHSRTTLKKATQHDYGSLVCPYCDKWLPIRLETKLVPGVVVCRSCKKEMLLDEKASRAVNAYNTSIRNTLCNPKKVVIYEGCKDGTSNSKKS